MTLSIDKTGGPGGTAAYIEQVTRELRDLARQGDLAFLSYLIEMARLEAASEAARRQDRSVAARAP